MSYPRNLIVACGVLAFCAGFAGWAWRLHTLTSARLTDADLQLGALLRAARMKSVASMRATEKPTPPSESTEPANPPKPQQRPKSTLSLIAANAHYRELYLENIRANLGAWFGAMYREFNLTPGQIARFEQLTTDRADDQITAAATAAKQKIRAGDPEFKAFKKQESDAYYAAISDEIGGDVSTRVAALDRMEAIQGLAVSILGSRVPGSPIPTYVEAQQLTQDLANASRAYQSGGVASTEDINWDAAYAQSSRSFSAEQLQAFRMKADADRVRELVSKTFTSHYVPLLSAGKNP